MLSIRHSRNTLVGSYVKNNNTCSVSNELSHIQITNVCVGVWVGVPFGEQAGASRAAPHGRAAPRVRGVRARLPAARAPARPRCAASPTRRACAPSL